MFYPLEEGSQFEAGYKGNFNNLKMIYFSDDGNNVGNLLSNTLEYKEKLMLFYTIWFQSK
jgi:hypothetical protein